MFRFWKIGNYFVFVLLFFVIIHPGFTHGLTEDRIHSLSHEIDQQPDNSELYLQRGKVLEDSERWNQALSDYKIAYEIDSDNKEALFRQGKTYLEKGELQKSIAFLQRYLEHLPHSPASHKMLARAYADSNKLEKAVHHYDLSIKFDLNPPPQIYLDRMQVLLRIKPLPGEQITSGLIEGIKKHGKTIVFSEAMINFYLLSKNYQQAINWLEELPESLKNSPYWLNKWAGFEQQRGDQAEALRLYNKSISQFYALPASRRNTLALVAARDRAQQEILRLKNHKQAVK